MMDPIAKASGKSSSSAAAESEQSRKACADCGTTRTPLWRGGPAGPKSLCNACGIRSRKKRRSVVVERKSKGGSSSNNGGGNEGKMGEKRLKWRFMAIGRGELKQKRKMEGEEEEEEEEEAAVLLMALSYGSVVYA